MRTFVMLGVLVLALDARAQSPTTGAIQGVLTDAETGEPLAGVTVIVSSEGTPNQSGLTGSNGAYKIAELPPGNYLVTFYYLDMTVERADIRVGVQKVTPLYHKMNTSAAKGEVVRVEGTTPTIDPTSTAQGITVDKDYLKNIPVPGRTFEAALGAAPGSQGDILGVAFSGSTSLENQYYVDGVNTTGLTFGTVGSPIINDFIEEIEIITGGYNAEYGRATGGIVNVVTKSGSNELKGSIFGYWRPGQLTAAVERTPRNATSIDAKADLGYSADFGFELGGPIKKDKLWYYVGFGPAFRRVDITRDIKRQTDCRTLLPDDTMSDCDTRLKSAGGFADGQADIDPETGFYVTELVESNLRYYNDRSYNMLGKVNYAATPEQQGQLTLQALPGSLRRPGIYGPSVVGFEDDYIVFDGSLKWTSKFNNNKTEVEATIGFHREDYNRNAIEPGLHGTPRQILYSGNLGTYAPHFDEGPDARSGCSDNNTTDKFPHITNCPMDAVSYSIGGPGSLFRDVEERRSARVGVTQRVKARGTHEIKAGLDTEDNITEHTRSLSGGSLIQNVVGDQVYVQRWVQITGEDDLTPRFDQMCFTPPPPTDPDAPVSFKCDFLSGAPGAEGTIVTGNTLNWAGYIRDSWQIKPNLTINVGLRYEEQRLRYAKHLQGQLNQITKETYPKNALTLRGEVAPRLGVLYDWTKEGRSKVYAHWGRFYESIPLATNNLNFGQPIIYLQGYDPGECGMTDMRIGGPDGAGCVDNPDAAANRQEMFGVYGSLIAPGTRGQYLDEIVAGTEYELVDDLKLGISFQNRRFGRVLEDLSVDGAQTYIVSNPGEWPKQEEEDLLRRINATMDPAAKTRLQNQLHMFRQIRLFDKPRRDYNAVQLTFTRRFSSKFYMQGSYTYSRTTGNYPGLINYDDNVVLPNASTQYDLIELLANRYGPLPQDRPHYVKLDGYHVLELKKHGTVTAGIRFRALSGVPRNALGPHYYYGDDQSFLMPRGLIGRSDFEHGLDVHLAYARTLRRHMKAEVFVDFYNVYNNQGVAAVDNTYAPAFRLDGDQQAANPVSGGSYQDLIWVKAIDGVGTETSRPLGRNPNFGNTSARYAPAYIRLGARVTF